MQSSKCRHESKTLARLNDAASTTYASTRLRHFIPPVCLAILLIACACGPLAAQTAPTPPVLLVATPDLGDPIFEETVILLLPGNKPPLVAGVILNRPTTIHVKTLIPHTDGQLGAAVAYFGGPVELNSVVILAKARSAPDGATPVTGKLYWMEDQATIMSFIKHDPMPKDVRICLGRAQWLPDQLVGEIQQGSWYVQPADPATILGADPKTMWSTLVERGQMQETLLKKQWNSDLELVNW